MSLSCDSHREQSLDLTLSTLAEEQGWGLVPEVHGVITGALFILIKTMG